MTAQELQDYFRSLNGGWMNLEKTVDTFKAGNPGTEITGIAVGWMSYQWALIKARQLGCNVFVTHEPTFYDHRDGDPAYLELGKVKEKKKLIEESGLVIIRCHDLWDQYPGIGIPDSWATFLGLSDPLVTDGYFRVYDMHGATAQEIARRVADRTKVLGQMSVQVFGPFTKKVTRLALGTGAITPYLRFIKEYQADMALCTDDGIHAWQSGALAIDCGIPMAVVNHAVSEVPGMINLAKHLGDKFPDVPVHHIRQRCMYQPVTA